jgi:hypothetical protein
MSDAFAILAVMIACLMLGASLHRYFFMPDAAPQPRRFHGLQDVEIARIAHEANRAFCLSHGDFSHRSWNNAEPGVKLSAIEGVRLLRANPHLTPKALHRSWCRTKIAQGYTYGPVKCHRSLKHPCLVPYHRLPEHQQLKDHLFHAIVSLFADG